MVKETALRKPAYIVGNWKMNKTIGEARAFISALALTQPTDAIHISLAVPFTMLSEASLAARGSAITIGAQDVSSEKQGAFTGDVSSEMVVDAGGAFALIGHSERRLIHHEDDLLINKKLHALLETRLQAIVCIGESKEERDLGHTQEVLKKQILKSLKNISKEQFKKIKIAYEPLWAIGTGVTATPDLAEQSHQYIRSTIASDWGNDVASNLIILYGGSVTPQNALSLLNEPNINGLLVGGASLDVEVFSKILHVRLENIAT